MRDSAGALGSAGRFLGSAGRLYYMQGTIRYEEDERRWSALMVSAQAGDQADYRLLLGELSTMLEAYYSARLGSGTHVDDCVQDTLLAIHEARHTYDPARPFRPWLFAIARRKAVDRIRREVRRREATLDAAPEVVLQQPDRLAEQFDSGRMLAALAEQYREPIVLTKIVGLSTAEAAATLNISESALKVRIHRGIRRLRRMWDSEPL